ncbi:MAG: hypothetical protein O2901_03410 [Verrucomicrobia bacterium]|nr:hypothetical protein [Verrucomicrobiota bacterium]
MQTTYPWPANRLAQLFKTIAQNESLNAINLMNKGNVNLILNRPSGTAACIAKVKMRSEAIWRSLPIIITGPAARAAIDASGFVRKNDGVFPASGNTLLVLKGFGLVLAVMHRRHYFRLREYPDRICMV